MGELGNMYWAGAAPPQKACPIVLAIFVEYTIADIVREKIFDLDRRTQAEGDPWINASFTSQLESLAWPEKRSYRISGSLQS
jgi:hypothetical protein